MTDLPKRKPTRLKNYDYSQNGAYFITIKTLLPTIVGEFFTENETPVLL